MAMVDYFKCSVCEGKTFYDAGVDYGCSPAIRADGYPLPIGVGDMHALCPECAETFEVVVSGKEDHVADAGEMVETPEAMFRRVMEQEPAAPKDSIGRRLVSSTEFQEADWEVAAEMVDAAMAAERARIAAPSPRCAPSATAPANPCASARRPPAARPPPCPTRPRRSSACAPSSPTSRTPSPSSTTAACAPNAPPAASATCSPMSRCARSPTARPRRDPLSPDARDMALVAHGPDRDRPRVDRAPRAVGGRGQGDGR